MLNLLIIDDEPLAHHVLEHHCTFHPDLNIAGHCYSATAALAWLAQNTTSNIDLLLLDINMPVLNGLDLLNSLENTPQVIITSAHQEYALDGYALDVTDYLLKPFSEERFASALDKVRRRIAADTLLRAITSAPEEKEKQNIILKVERERRKFQLKEITCFEAYGNYVKVWQGNNMVLVNSSLKLIREQLPQQEFIQVHKSFLINRQQVFSIDSHELTLSNQMHIKIGDAYKANVRNIF